MGSSIHTIIQEGKALHDYQINNRSLLAFLQPRPPLPLSHYRAPFPYVSVPPASFSVLASLPVFGAVHDVGAFYF